MNNDMKFDFPTSWRHGKGLAGSTGKFVKQLNCRRPLLLTDSLLVELKVVDPVTASLDKEKIEYTVCDEITHEPTLDLFESLTETLDLTRFDAIVAVGGGSVIDVAKGLALIGAFGGQIKDYAGFDHVPEVPGIKTIAIPTTAGTGSEISDGVVLIDEAQDTKFLVISKKICPTLAVTDPLMTLSMPPKVTAVSGVDALVHAIESYISKNANPMTESFSLRAVEMLSQGIKPAYFNGSDIQIREQMQIGATMAMAAGMNSYLGLCHALAMPLCALYHMPHGQAVGMALPAVLAYNATVVGPKIQTILKVMGLLADDKKADPFSAAKSRLEDFFSDIGIWARLDDFGFQESQMDTIVEATMASAQRPTNPRKPSPADIAGIVRRMR
jgi:alcohol dehydrogenase